jgi:hypothetical protein
VKDTVALLTLGCANNLDIQLSICLQECAYSVQNRENTLQIYVNCVNYIKHYHKNGHVASFVFAFGMSIAQMKG